MLWEIANLLFPRICQRIFLVKFYLCIVSVQILLITEIILLQAQSLAWLGMSITAIVAYGCNIDFTDDPPNYGTLLRRTIFHMYFRGKNFLWIISASYVDWQIELFEADDCKPDGWGNMDFTAIQNLDLMKAETVNIWMWVVASLSLIWLFSSVTLITSK